MILEIFQFHNLSCINPPSTHVIIPSSRLDAHVMDYLNDSIHTKSLAFYLSFFTSSKPLHRSSSPHTHNLVFVRVFQLSQEPKHLGLPATITPKRRSLTW